MKRILLITTGGTIVCRKTPQGLRPALQGKELLTSAVLEICHPDILDLMQVDSTDMRYPLMYRIGQAVWERASEYDGFVVTHGTDTMAYTAAFLSRILKNFGKPVILTGSMLPFGVPDSDAEGNLTGAMAFAASDYQGVGLYDCGRLIYGPWATKAQAEKVGAFSSMLGEPDGLRTTDGTITLREKREPQGESQLLPMPEGYVSLIRLTPSTQPEQLTVGPGCKAVILEAFGAGGIPQDLTEGLQALCRQGVRVYMKSQCIYGGSDLKKYEVGYRALEMGVVDLGAVTTEDAVAFALCQGL